MEVTAIRNIGRYGMSTQATRLEEFGASTSELLA
jgi:hypothetical protein